jgi:hypothetical protein
MWITIQNGVVDTKRPFFNPCIISSIKEFFFTGNRGTLAQKYEARFSSSIHDGPEKHELELSIPMVCIVATTVSFISLSLTESLHVILIQIDPCFA